MRNTPLKATVNDIYREEVRHPKQEMNMLMSKWSINEGARV